MLDGSLAHTQLTFEPVAFYVLTVICGVFGILLGGVVPATLGVDRHHFVMIGLNSPHHGQIQHHHFFHVKVKIHYLAEEHLNPKLFVHLLLAAPVPSGDFADAPRLHDLLVIVLHVYNCRLVCERIFLDIGVIVDVAPDVTHFTLILLVAMLTERSHLQFNHLLLSMFMAVRVL